MRAQAIVNASPLIFLARTQFLHLLQLAAPQVLVPSAVVREVKVRGASDPAVRALVTTPWLREVKTPPAPPELLAWDLGDGEAAVLSWALAHRQSLAIIDDLEGRRCAERSASAVLQALRNAGMYLSDRVVEKALSEIGEG